MKKTIKEIVRAVIYTSPVGREFTKEDLYTCVCKKVGRTVSRKYVTGLLNKAGEELHITSYRSGICYFRMLPSSVLAAIRTKVSTLKLDPNCSEEYLRKVLKIIFDYVGVLEVFSLSGFRKIINRVVPEVRIRYQLPANLEQVIASICLDKEREWNLNVTFPNNLDLCTVQMVAPKDVSPSKKDVQTHLKVENEEQLNRIEKKLDEILTAIKTVPVAPTKIVPGITLSGPVIVSYCQTSTENFEV